MMKIKLQDGRIGSCSITPRMFQEMRDAADKNLIRVSLFVRMSFLPNTVVIDIRFLEPAEQEAA